MNDGVSNRRIRVVLWAASMSMVWAVFILQGFPWTGLMWVSLAFSALWVAAPTRIAIPVRRAVL